MPSGGEISVLQPGDPPPAEVEEVQLHPRRIRKSQGDGGSSPDDRLPAEDQGGGNQGHIRRRPVHPRRGRGHDQLQARVVIHHAELRPRGEALQGDIGKGPGVRGIGRDRVGIPHRGGEVRQRLYDQGSVEGGGFGDLQKIAFAREVISQVHVEGTATQVGVVSDDAELSGRGVAGRDRPAVVERGAGDGADPGHQVPGAQAHVVIGEEQPGVDLG